MRFAEAGRPWGRIEDELVNNRILVGEADEPVRIVSVRACISQRIRDDAVPVTGARSLMVIVG